jgi:hypothetical protein
MLDENDDCLRLFRFCCQILSLSCAHYIFNVQCFYTSSEVANVLISKTQRSAVLINHEIYDWPL